MEASKVASDKSGRSGKKSQGKDLLAVQSDTTSVRSSRSRKSKSRKIKSTSSMTPSTSLPVPPPPSSVSESASPGEESTSNLESDELSFEPQQGLDQEDFSTFLCKLVAEDFWETAWDICETRFYHENASNIVVTDLRETWLSLVNMEFMDTDRMPLERVELPKFEDSLPLPPKVDFWAHGALELLPRSCRESVMDPFLREPFPWFLEKFVAEQQQVPDSTQSSVMQVSPSETIDLSDTQLVRPACAIPSTSEEEDKEDDESTWSITSTGGSFSNLASLNDVDIDISIDQVLSSPTSAASLASAVRVDAPKSRSIELIFPSKLPKAEIRASSEITYKRSFGSAGIKKSGNGTDIVAFKLPNQTSSEALKEHYDRKLRKPASKTSSSSQK